MPSELIRKATVSALDGDGASSTTDVSSDASTCFHCGDSLNGLKVVRRPLGPTLRAYCCNGCSFIEEQMFLAQAGQRDRQALGVALGPPSKHAPPASAARSQFFVRGMQCGACAQVIEQRLERLPGVARARVDYGTQRATLVYDEKTVSRDDLAREIERAGYGVGRDTRDERAAARTELLQTASAWILLMPILMLAAPVYFATAGSMTAGFEHALRVAACILMVPVVFFSARPLYRAAASQLKVRSIGIELPLVLTFVIIFVVSAVAALSGRGNVYFDSLVLAVALVLGARWLLARGLSATRTHLDASWRQSALTAHRLVAFPSSLATESIAGSLLRVGDRVLVPAGEMVPADGVVVHGRSSTSQAGQTGEWVPIEKSAGAPMLAGSVNLDQPVVVEVTRRGEAISLAALQKMVEEAGIERPRTVELVDYVAVIFLWTAAAVAAMTAIGWWWVDPMQALPNAIAVLIISCPCALSLAVPTAIAAARATLARRRILLARSAALESLAQVDVLACDKTGTLTIGEPALLKQLLLRDADPDGVLGIAAAMGTLSTHPYLRALVQVARTIPVSLPALADGRVESASGIEATLGGHRYRLGKLEFALHDKLAGGRSVVAGVIAREALSPSTYLVLADEQGPVAVFSFGERLREDAHALIERAAENGIESVVLSGDRREPVQIFAASLGIERALAHQTPDSKRGWVAGQQRVGRSVVMLGDGFNDAPAIAQADVSIALGGGAVLAQSRADLIVQSSSLADVNFAFATARSTLAVIHQNLAMALSYHVLAFPVAAFGLVSPATAVLGMAASSMLIIANALRIRGHVQTGPAARA